MSITQCSITVFVLVMVEQYTSTLLIHLSEWYVLIVALLLLGIILLILELLRWIKWSFYQYQIALILHLDYILFTYPQVIRVLTTQTVQWTMLKGFLVLLSILHPHSKAHTALLQTTRYLCGFVLVSILSQEQYQCHMLTLFITTVHLQEELYMSMEHFQR